jgi:hypothetical protein
VKFWVQDWLGAADIQRISIAAEGAWHRALCLMWHDGVAELSMTDKEWGHLWRLGMSEANEIIDELDKAKICEISRTGHLVTLVSRRLQRGLRRQEMARLRVQRHRGNAPVTLHVTPPVTPHVTGSVTGRSPEAQRPRGLEAQKPETVAATTAAEHPAAISVKVRQQPTGDHAETVTAFCEAFRAKVGAPYMFGKGKDGKIVSDLLKLYGKAKVLEMIGKFFALTSDDFLDRAGYTIGTFKAKVPALLNGSGKPESLGDFCRRKEAEDAKMREAQIAKPF